MSTNTTSSSTNTVYEIRDINATKGKGMFATQNIKPGDIIVQEGVAIAVNYEGEHVPAEEIYAAFQALSATDQARFKALTHYSSPNNIKYWSKALGRPDNEQYGRVVAIFENNCFSQPRSEPHSERCYCAIETSRINHSCNPNVTCIYKSNHGVVIVRAVRQIDAGDEVLISYVSPLEDRASRMEGLRDEYGFDCELKEIRTHVDREKKDPQTFRVDEQMKHLEFFIKNATSFPPLYRSTVGVLELYVSMLVKLGLKAQAKEWAREGHRLGSIVGGLDDEIVQYFAECMEIR